MSQSVTLRVGTENRPDFFCGALWGMYKGVNHQKELSMLYLRLLVNSPSVTGRKVTQLPLSSCWSYYTLPPSCTPRHCSYQGDPQDAAINMWVEISLTFFLRILLFLLVLRLLTVFLGDVLCWRSSPRSCPAAPKELHPSFAGGNEDTVRWLVWR